MSVGDSRVCVSKKVKEMIESIKEISGNHSDEEIHAMLKECSMDPNEAAQKLLNQDPFHEVRRRRDKRKETNTNTNRDSSDSSSSSSSRWRAPRAPPPRPRNPPIAPKDTLLPSSSHQHPLPVTKSSPPPPPDHLNLSSPVSLLGLYSSASDPVLVPSLHSRLPAPLGTIQRQLPNSSILPSHTTIPDHPQLTKPHLSSSILEKPSPLTKSHPDPSHLLSSSAHPIPNTRPSSRSHQLIASQKAVGPSKEWKPKPTNPNSVPASGIAGTCEVGPILVEAGPHSHPHQSASVSEESTSKLQQKLEELRLSHNQHVIIPNHLQVPEAERTGLSFGSFDANFGVKRCYNIDPGTDKSSTPLSESSVDAEEMAEEPCSSNQIESSTTPEGDYSDHPQSPKNVPDNFSPVEADVSSSAIHEYDQPKPETAATLGGPQYSVVHTAPNYNIGLMPPILGTQFAPIDSSEPQARDASRLPSFVVQQPFDPSASYYTQLYRPSADGDGRFSPYLTPGAANKFSGNIAVLSPQSGQPQESGNSLVHSTAGSTPLATQAAGVMPSSLAVTQQPVPVFRQPSGVHLPHYPPSYIPYNQYFSPFYVPPQTIHHYLTNTAYPQQPPTGNIYPPTAAAATGVKYPLSQYKPVANTGNSTHVGLPSGYAPYSTSPTTYSPSQAATSTNSTGNEDLSASQYKENNVYITGQQSEGSAVWIPAAGRDIAGLQASSFYSLSPQGQHVTFAPTQAGHGAFTGIYHPAQTMAAATVHPLLQQSQSMGGAVEMVGAPAGVYQQPQRAQMNWANNY